MLTEVNIADAVINDNSNKIYGFEPDRITGTSIVFHGKNNILYLEEGLNFKALAVETGMTNGTLTQITSGVSAGTEVLTDVQATGMEEEQQEENANPFMPRPKKKDEKKK